MNGIAELLKLQKVVGNYNARLASVSQETQEQFAIQTYPLSTGDYWVAGVVSWHAFKTFVLHTEAEAKEVMSKLKQAGFTANVRLLRMPEFKKA